MGATRIVILAVAALFAISLAFVFNALAGHKAPPPVSHAQSQPMAQVLVARRDLPQGTRLDQGDLGWQPWPVASLNPAFITDGRAPEAAARTTVAAAQKSANQAVAVAAATVVGGPLEARFGSIVRQPILNNEPITDVKLVRGGAGGVMAVELNPGMRAIAVPITVASAAGGFILPGDRVDVLQAQAKEANGGNSREFTAQVLLRNVRVLAIDQTATPPKATPAMVGGVATVEVAADDAEILTRAKAQGEVILTLRAYADAGGASGRAEKDDVDVSTIRIFRDGKPSEVTVTP